MANDDIMYHAKALVKVAILDFKQSGCVCGKSLASMFADNVKTVCAEYIAERAQHGAQSELDALIEEGGLSLDNVLLTDAENNAMSDVLKEAFDAATRIHERVEKYGTETRGKA